MPEKYKSFDWSVGRFSLAMRLKDASGGFISRKRDSATQFSRFALMASEDTCAPVREIFDAPLDIELTISYLEKLAGEKFARKFDNPQ